MVRRRLTVAQRSLRHDPSAIGDLIADSPIGGLDSVRSLLEEPVVTTSQIQQLASRDFINDREVEVTFSPFRD